MVLHFTQMFMWVSDALLGPFIHLGQKTYLLLDSEANVNVYKS